MIDLERQQRDTEYIATILWSIGRIVGGETYPMPTYGDFIRPKPNDNRNTEQIVSGLIDKLGKGVTAVGGNGTISGSG